MKLRKSSLTGVVTHYLQQRKPIAIAIYVAIVYAVYKYVMWSHPVSVTDELTVTVTDELTLTEAEVFNESFIIEQDDSRLLNFIKKNYLTPPSTQPYNLKNPTGDPSIRELQNQYALEILGHKRGGFFVESGAWDGERLSSTLVLERDYGWTGLLAEPNRKSFADLCKKNRKAWIANICLSATSHPQLAEFGELPDNGGYGQALSSFKKLLKVHKNVVTSKRPCFPLFSVLAALDVRVVDFVTLDVEGAELDVLKTIPFDKILIKIFTIEWSYVSEGKEALMKFMESKNYKLVKDLFSGTAADLIYAHESVHIPREALRKRNL